MSKRKKVWLLVVLSVFVVIALLLVFPTWTPRIHGEQAIAFMDTITVNGTPHTILVRGHDRRNPVILHVHGGPGHPDMTYARVFETELEKHFVTVRYDQRQAGKSYRFSERDEPLSTDMLVDDLLVLTERVRDMFDGRKVILAGHSFGTYIGLQAVAKAPEHYVAYVGIGQVANTANSERETLGKLLSEASLAGDDRTIDILEEIGDDVRSGRMFVPRDIIDRYGGYDLGIDDPREMVKGFLFRPETNGLDAIRFLRGLDDSTTLATTLLDHPLDGIVSTIEVPVHFIMGAHDMVTSPTICLEYHDTITAPGKSFTVFEKSAHFPHFEEPDRFLEWLIRTFPEDDGNSDGNT